MTLRPQITKEYVAAQAEGKPDFSILADNYEGQHKFYEPQYSLVPNRRLFHESEEQFARGVAFKGADEQLEKAVVQFRESPAQDAHHQGVLDRICEESQNHLYDSFM